MKASKPQSLTTDTRLSQSHFFNNSLLNKTNLTSSSQKYHQIPNSFQQQDSKQAQFLKVKNGQLQQRIKRMTDQIKELQDNKLNLLEMNEKYVLVLNQYYRNLNSNHSSIQNNNIQRKKNIIISKDKTFSEKKQKKYQSHNPKELKNYNLKQANAQSILIELEKDHRNLSKHVLAMETEIKNYAAQMEKFNQMKEQLLAVNHTTPKQLIVELEQTTQQNRELKKQNNRLNFQLQKTKAECNKLKKNKQIQNKNFTQHNEQLQKLKSQIHTITQQSIDKSCQYEQKIYDLELKCEKLENQLREGQILVLKNSEKHEDMQMQRVEDVHQHNFLRSSLAQLLDPKKHPLLRLDKSFVYKKKKSKSISLNNTLNNIK